MKRDNRGSPIQAVHRWNRPPLSCHACREKKRRCDRNEPCSNCTLRNIACEYSDQNGSSSGRLEPTQAMSSTSASQTIAEPARHSMSSRYVFYTTFLFLWALIPRSTSLDELLFRIRRLEDRLAENNLGNSESATTRPDFNIINSRKTDPV